MDKNWQKLIMTHLKEKTHIGVLTGSPITDIKITLVAGRAHQKHTEGGDFREATYRAIRQGLKKAKSLLLEPYYEFEMIKQVIPGTKIKKYKKSIIDGFYNIYLENGQVIYVNPFKSLILFGEIWNSSGNSLTSSERDSWQKELNGIDGGTESLTREDRVISELKKATPENKTWNKELVKQGIKDGNDFIFKGSGSGHGVGLSQWGANGLALKGKNYNKFNGSYI